MKRRVAGFALNALLRASIGAFLVDTLRHPRDRAMRARLSRFVTC